MPSCRKIVLRKGANLRRPRRRAGAGAAQPAVRGLPRVAASGASSTSTSPSPHFRLAAVLVETLICHRDGRNSLTCSSSVIEPPNTRGYLEKTVSQPSISANAVPTWAIGGRRDGRANKGQSRTSGRYPYAATCWARTTAPMPRPALSITYTTATSGSPRCTKPTLSSANVENVVNPPHTPTLRKRTRRESSS